MPKLTPRERRLQREFEKMKALRSEYGLFDFLCADLTAIEATEYLRYRMSADVVRNAWPGFMHPEEFERTHQNAPEKYIIVFSCKGLARQEDGEIVIVMDHAMEVVFGYNYPTVMPKFIWLTHIWHPNFKQPHVCIEGHAFAVGLSLDQIVTEVGRMVQYQSYNIKDPLNQEAAEWAKDYVGKFPVDDRDILDKRRVVGSPRRLVQIIAPEGEVTMQKGHLLELIEMDTMDVKSIKDEEQTGREAKNSN